MDFMVLIVNRKYEPAGEIVGMDEMQKYAAELSAQGAMRGGAPLQPESAGVRLAVRGGSTETVDGPFAESKEVVAGYFMLEAPSHSAALELAKRCPAVRGAVVTVHEAFADRLESPPSGTRHMLIFLEPPDFGGDPDGAKYRAMEKWTGELKAERAYVECAGLGKEHAKRIETLNGRVTVTDGPFAEAKEIVGGYAVVVAPSRAAAVAIAARCPHAAWGRIEVREVLAVGPG